MSKRVGNSGTSSRVSRGPVEVVVVAPTQTRLRHLERLVAGPEIQLAASAQTPQAAEERVAATSPGAILIDLDNFPNGLEAIERIMAVRATPIVVIGASADVALAALSAGAVDIIGASETLTGDALGVLLRVRLRDASRVRVITHPRARLRATRVETRVAAVVEPVEDIPAKAAVRTKALDEPVQAASPPLIVAIGASTGGPPALASVLRCLPPDLPAAVVVVQHMAEGFIEGLVHWLNEIVALPVSVAVDGRRLEAGEIYLAPAGQNLRVSRTGRFELRPPEEGQYHVPGVDATFNSVAKYYGPRAVGVLLTGMGRDGAAGLLAMRRAGAWTLGQDEATSAVWGMPAAARALLAVDDELGLPDIGPAIVCAVMRCLQPSAELS